MNQIIHLSALLNISVEQAFALFTQKSLLESWLALRADVELVVGGKYELFWDLENPHINSTLGCCISALVPQQLLAFDWRSPEQFQHFANQADPLTHCVVCFHPTPTGCSVQLVHSGWRQTPEWDLAREWQQAAWQMAFDALTQFTQAPKV